MTTGAATLLTPAEAEALVRARVRPLPVESRPLASLAGAMQAVYGAINHELKAAGVRAPLPAHMEGLMERKEHFTVLANDQATIERFIKDRARAGK